MGIKHKKMKGQYLENKVADTFKQIHNLNKDDVHRAQNSGNFVSEYGDVFFRDYNIIVECKNQQVVTFKSLFPKLSKEIEKFIQQLNDEERKFLENQGELALRYLMFLVVSDSSKRFGPFVIADKNNVPFDSELVPHILTKDSNNHVYYIFPLEIYVEHLNINHFKR